MNIIIFAAGTLVILVILGDAFETIVLPRLVTRQVRLSRLYFRFTWQCWLVVAGMMRDKKSKDTFLGFFGILSTITLVIFWATGLIIGFALLHWSFSDNLQMSRGFGTHIYLSGTTFYTLGLGDVVPKTTIGRFLVAAEAGLGFGFLALIISYLPLLNQSFARREVAVALLDSRAGSPPTAAEMILRQIHKDDLAELCQHLQHWERWSAELLENLYSYPILAFFRSHHANQSWLGSLTAILDASAFIMAGTEAGKSSPHRFTFAMARHTIIDVAQILECPPLDTVAERLPRCELEKMMSLLTSTGMALPRTDVLEQCLLELRKMYEPYVHSLSKYLHVSLPPWFSEDQHTDNWQSNPTF